METVEDQQENLQEEERSLKLPLTLMALFVLGAVTFLVIYYSKSDPKEDTNVQDAEAPQVMRDKVKVEDVAFREEAAQRGINFQHFSGSDGRKLLPETMGGGAAFLDYDNDGDQDLFLVNSASWDESQRSTGPTMAFFENTNGQFADKTKDVGLDVAFYGMGVAVGDFDGDGFQDLFVTAVGKNRLFRNNQGQRFVDVTEASGVGTTNNWSTSCAFLDHDSDGDLDLFVLNYVKWSAEIDLKQSFTLGSLERAFGPPTAFQGDQPEFYENLGNGKFKEVGAEVGVHVRNSSTKVSVGKSLGVVVVDFNDDNLPDLLVANDTVRNFAFKNVGGKFEEVGQDIGLAFDEMGNARGAMGIDVAHFRNDDSCAIAIGNFANEMTAFYVNDDPKEPVFIDEATSVGIGAPSRDSLTFGLLFFDCNLDGYEDLAVANGHVEPDINRVQESQSHAQAFDVFLNDNGRFKRLKSSVLEEKIVGRGLAAADIDMDGDQDLLVTANNGTPRLFINDQKSGRSIQLDLRLKDGKRKAIGSKVSVQYGQGVQRQALFGGGSYLSSSELILTFGLGKEERAANIEIRWPDGSVQKIEQLSAGRHRLIQP